MSNRSDVWRALTSRERLFDAKSPSAKDGDRSVFDMDHDRVVYSTYFRRMHDKTQVFPYAPLSPTGQARSRLSHSLEVSCVGRSLGYLAGQFLSREISGIIPYDMGSITATACLAHDIGNPPFGHAGEDAIKEWMAKNIGSLGDEWETSDIHNFEGNAQGFRILTRLEAWQRLGGLRTTLPTLAAFIKYPCLSTAAGKREGIVSEKKFGVFKDDFSGFREVYTRLGIPSKNAEQTAFYRHPLAFLTEAADDICYAVVDLEDAYHLGIITFDEVRNLLAPIAEKDPDFDDDPLYEHELRLARYRSAAISSLVDQAILVFNENIGEIESFQYETPLIDGIRDCAQYADIKSFSAEKVYTAFKVMEIESAGFTAISGLLDIFIPAVMSDAVTKGQQINRRLIPVQYLKRRENPQHIGNPDQLIDALSPYERIMAITDYISGMTDRYAIEIYQRLSGIKLPEY
jgi:dGTPase